MFVFGTYSLASTTSANPEVQDKVGEVGQLSAAEGDHMKFILKNGDTITSSVVTNVRVKGGGIYVSVTTKSGTKYVFNRS